MMISQIFEHELQHQEQQHYLSITLPIAVATLGPHAYSYCTHCPLLHPLLVVVVAPNHLRVSCHSKLQHVSTNVMGFWDEKEKLPPPCYFVVARVWTFGGCSSGGTATAIRGVLSSWVFFNPSTLHVASLNAT